VEGPSCPTEPLRQLRWPPSPRNLGEDKLRIIAGAWRGRPIEAPPGQGTRPTADRVRETLFSMLASRLGSLEELRVADLFAGSGALGLEALSRGAASASFVESDSKAAAVIRRNADKLGAGDRIQVFGGSALALRRAEPFDLVLADPPYGPGSGSAAVAAVLSAGWLAPGGWMSVETGRGEVVEPGSLEIAATRDVGRARLTLLRWRP
jgi:16S rRNA (guanine966-N2)-methyltransferase